jgi:GH25 family lysozyme M1 (1,4-beta-N-acetylmuramidase)
MATCRGLDVSAHQGPQDWSAHKREGVSFAFAKASEGLHTRDPRFATHIRGIKAAGLVPGAYHFAWPCQAVAGEAANYIAAVRPFAGAGFCHWLDLERYEDGRNYAGRSASQIRAWVVAWLAAVRAAFPGQRVGVYTSGSDLAAGHVPAGTPLWYPAYPWGAADYSRAESAARPAPSGWRPLIWQFTSQPLDRSIAYLSAAELRAWAAGTDSEEDPMAGITEKDINDAVWHRDTIAVSDDYANKTANPMWTAETMLRDTNVKVRALLGQVAAQTATIKTLAEALAAHDQAVDVDALVARIEAAIESVTVRLDVNQPTTPEA